MEKEILFCGKCCDKPLYVAGSYLPFVHKWTNGLTPYILEGGAFWDNCCANVNLVLQETVGQYLNLTDCKGRKIYDNALLAYIKDGKEQICSIEYSSSGRMYLAPQSYWVKEKEENAREILFNNEILVIGSSYLATDLRGFRFWLRGIDCCDWKEDRNSLYNEGNLICDMSIEGLKSLYFTLSDLEHNGDDWLYQSPVSTGLAKIGNACEKEVQIMLCLVSYELALRK